MLKRAPKGEAKQAQKTQHEWPQSIAPGQRTQLRSAATFLILQSLGISVHGIDSRTQNSRIQAGKQRGGPNRPSQSRSYSAVSSSVSPSVRISSSARSASS